MGNTLKLEDLLKPDCVPEESAGGENWRILHGDTLKLVKGFQPGIFDAVVTDPPYASGGTKQNERNRTTNQKYSSMKAENALPDFDGDNKDQRSWTHWMAEWLYDVRKACKRGAPICLFIDWRQYPSITDALQWAGWIWRGTAVWDKGNSRPQKGRFRQQAEYIVWGSNGPMPINRPVSCLPGVFRYGNPQNRIHVTEKPLQLMKDVIQICEPGGLILDPFAGAATTILAAAESGYQAVGIEVTDAYYKLGSDRVRIALEAGEEAENKEPHFSDVYQTSEKEKKRIQMSTRHPQSRNALWVFLFGKTPGRGKLSGQERRWSYWNRHLLMSAVLQKRERPKYSGTAGRSTNWDMYQSVRSTAFPHSLMRGMQRICRPCGECPTRS